MAGDVADIVGDWQITIASADASIGLLRGLEDATEFSSSGHYAGWMFGVDRQPGDAGYTSGIWFYYSGINAGQARFQIFSNWQDLAGDIYTDNGYGTRVNYINQKYAVYDQSDWQSADPLSTLNFTYCADSGNSFFSFSGNNPNATLDQNDFGWGFVRLARPGGSYVSSSEWVFTYHLPGSTSEANELYPYSEMRVVTMGAEVATISGGAADYELPFSSNSGYLMRSQPVLARGGLAGYMPPGLGWNDSYDTLDQMIDESGNTWIKCHSRQWVKVQ